MSAVALIVSADGSRRVVVTELARMQFHVHAGEQIFVVPGLEVEEPVPWHMIPQLIEAAERGANLSDIGIRHQLDEGW